MADDSDIEIKLAIDTVGAEKSVKEIKKALVDLKDVKAGSDQFEAAQKAAAEYKDKLDDLMDATKTLKGSGIEKLTNSMNLLKEGFVNADPGKLGIAMKGLGTAMKAIPIFLIIEGIRYLVENFEKLANSGGILGKVFSFIGDVVEAVIQAFKDFTDWLRITNNAIEDNAEKQIEAAKATQEAVTNRYDAEIKLAKAAGKETFELEIKKQKAIIDSTRIQFEAIKAVAAANGEVTKEQTEKVLALGKMIKDANLEIQVKQLEHKKSIADINQKAYEENKAISDKEKEEKLKEFRKAEEEYDKHIKAVRDKIRADEAQGFIEAQAMAQQMYEEMDRNAIAQAELRVLKDEEDTLAQIELLTIRRDIELENDALTASEKLLIQEQYSQDLLAIKEAEAEKEKQLNQDKANASLDIAKTSNDSMIALSDLFFAVKQANTRKGSAEELKAAKAQFKISKALAITTAVISGIQGVINALSAQSVIPEPFGTILKVASAVGIGIAAAANVAKIAATQFNPGGGGGGSVSAATPATGGGGAGASSSTPVAPSFDLFGGNTNNETANNASNKGSAKQPVVKAIVIGQEVTDQQTADKYANKMGEL